MHTCESSVATRKRFWLWMDTTNSPYDHKVEVGAHLSAAEIRKLIKLLERTLTKHRFN